jgi:2-amino-4-hydroxy-6-hydroxymethyldihydropteridine diphosphokinase
VDTIAYVGLGSNVGDRSAHLNAARNRLARVDGVTVLAASTIYESEAVGGPPGQDPYLNAVFKVRTRLDAAALLDALHVIERELGRRRSVRWGPRTIDLDLLLFGDATIRSPELCVPHPEMNARPFVLAPLAELDPHVRDPVSGRTARELLSACPSDGCRVAVNRALACGWDG